MEKFIYFSARLTEKLNAIYKYPITIVNGRAGIGKSFAVQTFLQSGRTEIVWHASKAADFGSYLRECRRILAAADGAASPMKQTDSLNSLEISGAAVETAAALKHHGPDSRRAYVLEYQDGRVPEEILEFLDSLSNQRVRGLYILLIARLAPSPAAMEHMGASANVISEDFFLLTAAEIRQAFTRNGIPIGDAEAGYLYLRSAGWLPEIVRLFHVMSEKGKTALYEDPNPDAFQWDGSEEWNNRFLLEEDIWRKDKFEEIRRQVEAMELEEAYIAVERMRMKSKRFSPEWDLCDHYSAVLKALQGSAKAALEELDRGFAIRAQEGLYGSANRINLAQIQLRILLGGPWFEAERELLAAFADRCLYENSCLSGNTVGLALWWAKKYPQIIAFFSESDAEDAVNAGYREFLLAAAYHEIGFVEEAALHLDRAWTAAADRTCLSAILVFEAAVRIDRARKDGRGTGRADMPPEFREKLAVWRRAMRRNSAGVTRNAQRTLTVREAEIAECVARRMTNKEIAAQLNISENTVKTTLKHIFSKLDITRRQELQ